MQNDATRNERDQRPSRRNFLAPVAAGAVATALLQKDTLLAATTGVPSITIPKDITDSLAEPTKLGEFSGQGMTGAEVFARACKEENLAALFCCPGNYPVIGAISAAGVPSYGGRSEGSMTSAADGFSRCTGEVTACSGTEGPGFTNMIMNIAVAHRARTPLLVLASNVTIASDDRETFIQTGYQQPTTEGLKKYGKRLIAPDRVHEYAGYAFRYLKTGVPAPVHLDFPGEIVRARFTDPSKLKDYYTKDKYRTESRPYPSPTDMAKAVDMINKAERPILIAGQGVFLRKAWEPLMAAAEKNEFAVVTSGPMRGHFPDEHRLSASLSPDAITSADLIIFVGQYAMPSPNEYRANPDVKTIRVNPAPEDLGRNWPLDLGIVADEAAFIEGLASDLPRKKRDMWVNELASARAKVPEGPGRAVCRRYQTQRVHKHPPPGGALPGSSRFSLQGKHRSETDRNGLGRMDHRELRGALSSRLPARSGSELPVSVLGCGPGSGHDDRRGCGRAARRGPAGALQRRARGCGDQRCRHHVQHV